MPQITGDVWPELPVAVNESTQTPPRSSAVLVGPCVVNDSKSRRTEHTSEEHLFIVYVRAV